MTVVKRRKKEQAREELKALLASLIENNYTVTEILDYMSSNGHKMCMATLYNNLKRFELPAPISEKKKSRMARDLEIVEYYETHEYDSLRDVGAHFGMSHEAVRKILTRMAKCKEYAEK